MTRYNNYHDDPSSPHIHAEYRGHEALISLINERGLAGSLPRRATKLIAEWIEDHRDELMENWCKAVALEPLDRIAGADND